MVCKSRESEVLRIKASDFERRLSSNEESWSVLKAMALSKAAAIQFKLQRMRAILEDQQTRSYQFSGDVSSAIVEEMSKLL